MPKHRTEEEVYGSCKSQGLIRNLEQVNIERIKSLMQNADICIDSAKALAKLLPKNDRRWMNVYTLHYDAIHLYAEALLIFERISSQNHQCLFAALCAKREGMEFDWNFFEKIRTARNGINYYGKQVGFEEFKEVEVQFVIYLSALKKEIEKRL